MRVSKENKKEQEKLTKLVLCGLLLGGSVLYAPMAEAENAVEVTSFESYAGIGRDDNGHYIYTKDGYWLSFNSDASEWQNYAVYGGFAWSQQYSSLTNRTVVMEKGIVRDVAGGRNSNMYRSYDGSGNKVTIKTGTVRSAVYGGWGWCGNFTGNSVTIGVENAASGPTIGAVYGGSTEQGDASNNTVTIYCGTVNGQIAGGNNTHDGSANNNNLIIKGGTVKGQIVGGNSDNGSADNNNSNFPHL